MIINVILKSSLEYNSAKDLKIDIYLEPLVEVRGIVVK